MRKTIKNRILSLFGGFAALCIALAIAFMPTAVVHADDTVSVTSLVTAGENVTLTGNVAYSTEQSVKYPGGGGTNMTAISSTTSGKVTSKLIDLSTLSTSDYVMQWIPATQNISIFTLRLIDENDASNYVQVNFSPNYAINYNGTSYGASMNVSYVNTSGTVSNTGGVYAYGAVMGNWSGLMTGSMYTGDGFNAGDSWLWFDSNSGYNFTPFFVGYDYTNGDIITPRKTWSSEYEMSDRKPFSSSIVYAELYWESTSAGGVAIKTVAGFNTNGATVAKQTPTITAATIADAGIGDTITPTATVSECYTHNPVLSFVPYYYENSAWTDKSSLVSDGKFVPDAEGDWKVVWTADYNASAEKTFEVSGHSAAMILDAGSGVTMSTNVAYSTAQSEKYPGGGGTNVTAISSTTSGKVTSKLIDLSTLTTSDYVMQWIPATQNITLFTLRLIDENDASNYVQVNFSPNYAINYNGTSYGATMNVTYVNTSGTISNTGGVYAYGAVMGDWSGLMTGNMYTGDGFNAGDKWDWFDSNAGKSFTSFFVGYDYTNGDIVTPRKTWNSEYELPSRKPFSSSKVYAELYWESSAAGGVAIKTVADIDTTSEYFNAPTTLTVSSDIDNVLLDETESVAIPSYNAFCYFGTTTSVKPYYYNGSSWTDKSALVSNGGFTPDATGSWKVVYTANSEEVTKEFLVASDLAGALLGVKFQTKNADTDGKLKVRFLATVDSLDYTAVGFEITYGEKVKEVTLTKVYTGILGEGDTPITSSEVSGWDYSEYVIAFSLDNVPVNTEFTVRAFFVTGEGKTYGEARTINVGGRN